MSWLSLYLPAPTAEGIWDQCTLTAQAAQGLHEDRTLTQLRADVAAALLLSQSMSQNHIYSPVSSESTAGSITSSTSPVPTSAVDQGGAGDTGPTAVGSEHLGTVLSPPDMAEFSPGGTAKLLPGQSTNCSGNTVSEGLMGNSVARRIATTSDLARERNNPGNLY